MFYDIYKSSFNELDAIKKQVFAKNNPLDCSSQKYVIFDLKLAAASTDGPDSDKINFWLDFVLKK